MNKIILPKFATKKELHTFLVQNKESIMAQKKAIRKFGDEIAHIAFGDPGDSTFGATAFKANTPVDISALTELKVKVAINSTNLLDSHLDVHLKGLWKKSVSENKLIMHLQEHRMEFASIISDGKDLKVYTEVVSWGDLGYKYPGDTELLVFESTIKKARNPFMLDQYGKGYVRNHSVGMQYVAFVLCVNDEDPYFGAEYEAWQKYYSEIANSDAADEWGYFWAVKEAKVIEGSAVPIGSNFATPTLDNNLSSKEEPGNHSNKQPDQSTAIDYGYLMDNLKIV